MRGIENVPWIYDGILSLCEWLGLGRWRAKLVAGANGVTLDLGCGTGRNLPLYDSRIPVLALDPNPRALHRARRRTPAVALVRGTAEQLPFRDGAFDTVVSGLVFCTVRDPARALAEVRRVIRPGGQLRMLEHVRAQGQLAARWQDFVQPLWTWVTGGCHPNRDTERSVEACDFRIEQETRRAKRNMRLFSARPAEERATAPAAYPRHTTRLGPKGRG